MIFFFSIHLQKLIAIVSFRTPCSNEASSFTMMQSGAKRGIKYVPMRRGSDFAIVNTTTLHSHRSVTQRT